MTEPKQRQPRVTLAQVTRAEINSIAGAAIAHPETVVKALNGVPVRGDVGVRIEKVLRDRGLRTA